MGHAAAVIGDADAPPSATVGEDVDAAGGGVDGVLNQLLHHARGTLHHLAGGDAVDDLFWELADGHGRNLVRRPAKRELWSEKSCVCTNPSRCGTPLSRREHSVLAHKQRGFSCSIARTCRDGNAPCASLPALC